MHRLVSFRAVSSGRAMARRVGLFQQAKTRTAYLLLSEGSYTRSRATTTTTTSTGLGRTVSFSTSSGTWNWNNFASSVSSSSSSNNKNNNNNNNEKKESKEAHILRKCADLYMSLMPLNQKVLYTMCPTSIIFIMRENSVAKFPFSLFCSPCRHIFPSTTVRSSVDHWNSSNYQHLRPMEGLRVL